MLKEVVEMTCKAKMQLKIKVSFKFLEDQCHRSFMFISYSSSPTGWRGFWQEKAFKILLCGLRVTDHCIFIFRGERCSKLWKNHSFNGRKSATRATKMWHSQQGNVWVLTILSFTQPSLFSKELLAYIVLIFKWMLMKKNKLCDDWNWSALICAMPRIEGIFKNVSQSGI